MKNQCWPLGKEEVKELPKAAICLCIYLPFLGVSNDLSFFFDSNSYAQSSHLKNLNWNSADKGIWVM